MIILMSVSTKNGYHQHITAGNFYTVD